MTFLYTLELMYANVTISIEAFIEAQPASFWIALEYSAIFTQDGFVS